ncbi:hypothetical protein [Kitasatospora sp. NPDC059571]|uniref:hypothetical protein n=1 Tax=Kitasatospora sp. NPDC059571 TaxID=3346871 RepID=UPI0036974579
MIDVTEARAFKNPRRLRTALVVAGLAAVIGAGAADWGFGTSNFQNQSMCYPGKCIDYNPVTGIEKVTYTTFPDGTPLPPERWYCYVYQGEKFATIGDAGGNWLSSAVGSACAGIEP